MVWVLQRLLWQMVLLSVDMMVHDFTFEILPIIDTLCLLCVIHLQAVQKVSFLSYSDVLWVTSAIYAMA
jgi:hypothetical protein